MEPRSAPISPTTLMSPTTLKTSDEAAFTIPELNESKYLTEVLCLPLDKSECQADKELVARANAIGLAATLPSEARRRQTSSAHSYSSLATYQDRGYSTASTESASTFATPRSSVFGPPSPIIDFSEADERRDSAASLNFSRYERYLATLDSSAGHPKFLSAPPASNGCTPSVFSASTKKSLSLGFRNRIGWRKKSAQPISPTQSCITCRDIFDRSGPRHSLPCGHTHCAKCLRSMISKAGAHESQMPPRCCSRAIPSPTVRAVLSPDDQEKFLIAVLKYSTPGEERIFCPNSACGEFVPTPDTIDPKHPFDISCLKCHGRLCAMCKKTAHPIGKDCPQDWELAAMKKLRDGSSWKRCFECRNLVECGNESGHMTCKCKAQFCSVCGGIWDPTIGCPNICNYEEELERRRLEEENCDANAEVATTETQKRSRANSAIQRLGQEQQEELRRFLNFESQAKRDFQSRKLAQKAAVMEKYAESEVKMKERHDRAVAYMENRQIAAELELQTSLEQSERSLRLRLKHMEAYCDGLGRHPSSATPVRIVTERDLRELGQQYNLRDGIEQMHQSKINVMRDRQAKQMEDLLDRQETEMEKITGKRQAELDKLGDQFAQEETLLSNFIEARQARLNPRWVLAIEVLCKELQGQTGQTYARIAPPRWPEEEPELELQNAVEPETYLHDASDHEATLVGTDVGE